MNTRRTRAPAAFLLALAMVPAGATFHLIKIVELFPGTAAAPDAQYVVLQMYAPGQHLLDGHAVTFHDASGNLVGSATFPANVANGDNQAKVLVATPEAADFFGVMPDLLMDSDLLAAGGKACFAGTIDCVAWGGYTGGSSGVGTPFNAGGGLTSGRAVLRRLDISGSASTLDAGDDTNNSATDFVFGLPAPRNNAGQLGHVPGATCGNGAVEGLEQCDDGNLSNNDTCSSTCQVQQAPAPPPEADFDGDRRSDVLWRHNRTGENAAWRSASAATPLPVTDVTSLAWKVVGLGDFDGDRRADIFWRNGSTGGNTIWRSANSTARIAVTTLADLAWRVAGIGDFNGDGKDDVFWRNANTGANTIWRSASSSQRTAVSPLSGQAWQVVAVGDFDDDGKDDVVWRNGVTGANQLWRSGNAATPLAITAVTNTDWLVVGAGDFDADGHDDLLWRNAATGGNTIWRSARSSLKVPVTAVTNLDWRVEEIADYNGDGHDDLFWRNAATGGNTVWRSADSRSRTSVATLVPRWKVVP